MDLDSDYYSSRCVDINGLSLFKGTCMMFVGGDSDHQNNFIPLSHKGIVYSVGVEML
jgi:hypothetical protein